MEQKNFSISKYCFGNPLLDISVNGTEEFLNKYDLKPDNAILAEDKHKSMYSDMAKTFADHVEYIPGGATLNAIKLAQVRLTTRSQNVCCN
ncbi:adenosine kinase [Mytilus galloprovincialis]|uniref:Adenosine kinase n=1 Tax=Mytilus galloprovincialis TaxID=29158 RepID=A0A8B6FVL9_MYTGA|nr:adenosine kinase [Mytilus galloprovincialis]